MKNIKLFRTKINEINQQYGFVFNQKPTDTHLISLSVEIDGNVLVTNSKPLSPNQLKNVYQECLNEILKEYKQYKMVNS